MGQIIGGNKKPKARKEHTCWWCGETIAKGETYKSWAWVDSGEITRIKTHKACFDAWGSLDFYDAEEVPFASYTRGCTCPKGDCGCNKKDGE